LKKYSDEEISQMLGIGKTKTRELLQSKLLPVTKIGRDYFTSKTAIMDRLRMKVIIDSKKMIVRVLYMYFLPEEIWAL
jgi:excisionase family DNA binding protein